MTSTPTPENPEYRLKHSHLVCSPFRCSASPPRPLQRACPARSTAGWCARTAVTAAGCGPCGCGGRPRPPPPPRPHRTAPTRPGRPSGAATPTSTAASAASLARTMQRPGRRRCLARTMPATGRRRPAESNAGRPTDPPRWLVPCLAVPAQPMDPAVVQAGSK